MTTRKRRFGALIALATTAALAFTSLGATPATAAPGDPTPGTTVGQGTIAITGSTTVREGESISFAGEGLAVQTLSIKFDASGPGVAYTGTGALDAAGVVATVQVQPDGTVSGSVVIPTDIDEVLVNPWLEQGKPHFLRFLGSSPATSLYTQGFETLPALPTPPTTSPQCTAAKATAATTAAAAAAAGAKAVKAQAKFKKAKKAKKPAKKVKKLKAKAKKAKKASKSATAAAAAAKSRVAALC